GRNMLFEASASLLKGDNDEIMGFIILLRDITELQHLKKEVLRKERLASLGSLAAGVAHEIRNPLGSIKGFATYFKERYKDVPEDRRTADIMIKEVERLNRVIGQLLEFARPMSLTQKQVDLKDTVKHSVEMIRGQARAKGIEVVADNGTEEGFYAAVDQDKIAQVLLNVYLNALDAMDEGGRLSIAIGKDELNAGIVVSISDTGHGISAEDLSRVFDPYFTTKQSGTGLGLAIVHKIMEAHAGTVKIESRKDEGTTVSLTLPCAGKDS
ncbi:MAG TPA: ATP-binding protein, partial [Deltaproteobacteria bacterium]|nr:ATP-binding protein [Deltaproteobacteria bacterium]